MAIGIGSSTLRAFVNAVASELGKRPVDKVKRGGDTDDSTRKIVQVNVRCATQRWRKDKNTAEITTVLGDDVNAFDITDDLPDEALRILLDLGLASTEAGGRHFHWNPRLQAWESRDRKQPDVNTPHTIHEPSSGEG
jgi:hypothetical protein